MRTYRLLQWTRFLLQPMPLFGMAIVGIFWIGLAYLLSVERSKTLDDAIAQGSNLARLLEENTIRLFKGVDRALLLLRLAYEKNPDNFNLRQWLDQTSLLGDLTVQAALIGADGYMKGTTAGVSGAPLNLGDREHFLAHVNAKSDEAYFFGEDTVIEAIVCPPEIRGKLPGDFGRDKGVAWYALEGFAIVHTLAAQSRIVKWASAT